jgi:hypothetical protein
MKSVFISFGVMQVERGFRSGIMMMFGLLVVAVREMRVVTRVLMVAFLVMTLRGAVMLGRLFVVHRGSSMMFGGFCMVHGRVSLRACQIGPPPSWRAQGHAEMTGARQSRVRTARGS